jgi:hypothetical protein
LPHHQTRRGGEPIPHGTVQTLHVSLAEFFFEHKGERTVNPNGKKIKSKEAEKEKNQSEERERTIAELSRAIEQLEFGKGQPGEGILAVARELAAQWKIKKRPLFEGLLENKRLALLVALVVALREDHRLVARIRRHFPDELNKLGHDSFMTDALAAASGWANAQPQPTERQKYEREHRRKWHRNFRNSIEYQFGGGLEAEWKKQTLLFSPDDPFYKSILSSRQDCLDDIFAGYPVNMQKLEDLFDMDRHRLSKVLQGGVQKGRYDYRDVAKIMEALLSEKRRRKRKRRGRSLRNPWLDDPDDPNRRRRVLNGIKARINRLSVEEEIRNTSLAVIQRHLPNSGKK